MTCGGGVDAAFPWTLALYADGDIVSVFLKKENVLDDK